MIETIFTTLPQIFIPNTLEKPMVFYFSLGDVKKTVEILGDCCRVTNGKIGDNADCVCKTSPEFFLRIWQENYRPGMKDFMTGTIKSNNPTALLDFLKCFGKNS